ncbi:uncharacterized protein G2W53_022646 [Senna tora]|uniref:Uncharacterized protein n=1 Tax=Senna tora TaxID=362788 RepID=A0A834TMZ6_9FABA|nr:uncharacterized protein G2W53_022646 [Senna tora]
MASALFDLMSLDGAYYEKAGQDSAPPIRPQQ